jgi:hypothetical protein
MFDAVISLAKLLAALWVVVGTMWLLYRGVMYILAAATEVGMPAEEKEFSPVGACFIAVGELAFLAIVCLYFVGRL